MEVELKKANVQFIKKKINKTSELKKFDHIIVCAGGGKSTVFLLVLIVVVSEFMFSNGSNVLYNPD